MHAILTAALVVASTLAADRSPSPVPGGPASAQHVIATSSPFPGSPLEVTLTRISESNVLTWLPPTRCGASAVVGYAVIDGDSARYVGADVTRVVVSSGSNIAVASINGSGCRVASRARLAAADGVAQVARLGVSR